MSENTLEIKEKIRLLVHTKIESFASNFQKRHLKQVKDPKGILNMKIHNVFISALGSDIQYYAALVRSFDSSLGNMLEELAIDVAQIFYDVTQEVEGPLGPDQTTEIASLLEKYKRHERVPSVNDYNFLRVIWEDKTILKRHDSDYCLIDKETGEYSLIELKIGGDLDVKKARSEKEALLEQLAILSNIKPIKTTIKIFFATAYNRFGVDEPWKQERVLQYFAKEELLIGRDFWNFICKSTDGYETIMNAYKEKADLIRAALNSIKKAYLG